MNNLDDLKTSDEFITHYYDELKRELKSQDLNISKVGVIGYILNVLGNLQFDIKNYYDGLFKEAFPIASTHDENLEQHARTFNYTIEDSVAAYLNGTMLLDFQVLPTLPPIDLDKYNILQREIELTDLQFQIGDLKFLILTNYNIYIRHTEIGGVSNVTYWYKYTDKNGIPQSASFQATLGENEIIHATDIELIECYQIEKEEFLYSVPLYPFGSYYTIEIALDSFIDSVEISVKEDNSNDFIPYDTSLQKIFSERLDRCVFYSIITKNNIRYVSIELGSGVYGKYIPNSEINIILYKTKGAAGNIPAQQIVTSITGNVFVTDTFSHSDSPKSEIIEYPINISNLKDIVTFDILEGIGGKDRLHGNDLRKSLISFIQSRDNLLNDLDFRNILSKVYKYFNFILKKVNFQDNLIMVYVSCLDKNLLPQKTLTYPLSEADIISAQIQAPPDKIKPYFYHPETSLHSKQFVSPFLYIYDSFLNVYKGYLLFETLSATRTDLTYTVDYLPSDKLPIVCPLFNLNVEVGVGALNSEVNPLETAITLQFLELVDTRKDFNYTISISNLLYEVPFEPDPITEIYTYTLPELLIGRHDILINLKPKEVENQPNYIYTYVVKFNDFQIIYDYSDYLVLKIYDTYVLDVPLIGKTEFESVDKNFYLTSISSQLNLLYLRENRLMSDEIKLTFLNSYFISGEYLSKISVQEYDTDLFFPLKLKVYIVLVKNYGNNLVDLINSLKLKIAKFLNTKTGNKIKFYSSELVELIHMEGWIKHASIKIYDNNDLLISDINGDNESNIETYDIQDKLSLFSKTDLLTLSPPLFWWDINNIEINYRILGE